MLVIATRPVVGQAITPTSATLLLTASAFLLVSLPAMYVVQATESGALGLGAHVLLTVGLLLVVVVAAPPVLDPGRGSPTGEHPLLFVLGIALSLGMLLTGIATFQAGVFAWPASLLLLAAMAAFFFLFFVVEFLPPIAGQIGLGLFAILLAAGFTWIGVELWSRS
jgi:hypothetical protein